MRAVDKPLLGDATVQDVLDLVAAARALYERVQMDESVGICLSSRTECLILGDKLACFPMPEEVTE